MIERTNVLVLGLPGSGKSTLCETLTSSRAGLDWLSASAVLRRHQAGRDDRWAATWATGHNAPDDEVLPVLWTAFERRVCTTLILDGYPRTPAQLADFVTRGGRLDMTIYLRLTMEGASARIRARSAFSARPDSAPGVAEDRLARERVNIDALLQEASIRAVLHEFDAALSPEVVARQAAQLIHPSGSFSYPISAP